MSDVSSRNRGFMTYTGNDENQVSHGGKDTTVEGGCPMTLWGVTMECRLNNTPRALDEVSTL